MAKCLTCDTSKFFLKLSNGLCDNCLNALNSYEDKYKELLHLSQDPKTNVKNLISDLISLSIDLRKFDEFSKGIKSSDCEQLISLLSSKAFSSSSEKEISFPIKKLILPEDFTKESLNKINTVNSSKNNTPFPSNNVDTPINDVPISKNSTYDNIENTDFNDENILDISEHILSDLEEEVNVEDIPSSNHLEQAPSTVPISPKALTISDEDKNEIKNIIDILNSTTTSIDIKCYHTFLLRDKYLPILKDNNIVTIFDTDIEDLISKTLHSASLILECPIDNIYSFYNYVAFSIQTTGIHLNSNYIIELAAVRISFGQIEETFHTLINPKSSISLANETKTGITNLALSKAPTLDVVLQDFKNFTKGLTLVTHNANFNYKFIDINYKKLFNEPLNLDVLCTIKLYRKRYKQFHGEPTKDCSLYACCHDLLNKDDLSIIDDSPSIALSSALGTFKIYEIIKLKYK